METYPVAGTLWRKTQGDVSVKILKVGFLRIGLGRTTKKKAVFYESLHDGEMTARVVEEFKRLFLPL